MRIWSLRTGKLAWSTINRNQSATRVGTLLVEKGDPTNPNGWWGETAAVYFPSAGCYAFFAQWKGGAWLIPYAAGR
ncbi:MAG TPA: hypothetical protein VFB58_06000 [Chloroflexota bacterium]|nr:hypothetical protein [Chloroflexota bacterium]